MILIVNVLCVPHVQEQCCGVVNYTDFVGSVWYNQSRVWRLPLLSMLFLLYSYSHIVY